MTLAGRRATSARVRSLSERSAKKRRLNAELAEHAEKSLVFFSAARGLCVERDWFAIFVFMRQPRVLPIGSTMIGMAATASFDITSTIDFQEVDNALNQARKEVGQRYDFKGAKADIVLNTTDKTLTLVADDEFKMNALWEIVQTRLVRRGVPIKNFKAEASQPSAGGTVRRVIPIQQGIPIEAAREIVKFIKDQKLKKVQAAIQSDQVRVSSPSKDDLQDAMRQLREHDFGVALQFGNYR